MGATVVFSATGTVDPAATGELVNTAAVFPPVGYANRISAIASDHTSLAVLWMPLGWVRLICAMRALRGP